MQPDATPVEKMNILFRYYVRQNHEALSIHAAAIVSILYCLLKQLEGKKAFEHVKDSELAYVIEMVEKCLEGKASDLNQVEVRVEK